jgi:hypothetical protein
MTLNKMAIAQQPILRSVTFLTFALAVHGSLLIVHCHEPMNPEP